MISSAVRQTRILILGSSGFLGSNLRLLYSNLPEVYFAYSNYIESPNDRDFQVSKYSRESIAELIEKLEISVVINCVGFTDVDACEQENSLNFKLNLELPLILADLCRSKNVKLVQISTDHYFSEHSNSRSEEEFFKAINEYGKMKLQADKTLLLNENSLIIRTNFFGFDPSRRGKLLDWAKSKLENGEEISGFADVYFTPISVTILASTLIALIGGDFCGVFNVVSSESISKFDFLRLVADSLGCNQQLVLRSSIRNSRLKVQRPNFLSLSNNKLKQNLPDYKDYLISDMISLEIARYKLA